MLFNSIDFLIFLPIVFIIYWFVVNKNIKLQNLFIVIASYVFYGWWDWRFLSLIIFSTMVDFIIGLKLENQKNQKKRKLFLWVSILTNLGLLGFFKYYNFFVENFITAFSFLGYEFSPSTLNIVLPVGISFYTFQTLSYTIDVYREKLKPTKDFIAFAAFVSFFPQLVAGPIERATHLLPQFFKKRVFDYQKAVDGMRQILWGFFKKMVIADNCAIFANEIFNNSDQYSGSVLVLGAFFFAFQIYGDFSGYSDIAIGTSRLFGFDLKQNFAFPYFSRDIAEFWRRWHISLSTWFRDYLYIPLGGSRGSVWKKVRNTFIIFIVSGFWHGANWTFISWGAVNAFFFLPLLLSKKNRIHTNAIAAGKSFPNIKEFFQILITFCLTLLAWIFFRAENISHAINYLSDIFSQSLFTIPNLEDNRVLKNYLIPIYLIIFLIVIEWISRNDAYGIEKILVKQHRLFRWLFYAFILFLIGTFMRTEETPFIYFQF
jgi:D-alanyl-lipoteichoic acid acyltransferase DltB (MBOAT superfamily)